MPATASPQVYPIRDTEKSEFWVTFGENVRTLRRSRKWTQQQLADAAGLSRGTVNRIENAQRAVDFQIVCRLADVFGASVDALRTCIS